MQTTYPVKMAAEVIGDRDVVRFAVRFDGPRYTQYQRNDDGRADHGDDGRPYVDDDGHLVLVSDNTTASGGATVLTWAVKGDELTDDLRRRVSPLRRPGLEPGVGAPRDSPPNDVGGPRLE